jgi:transposase
MREGFVASLVEWKNRAGSGMDDRTALALAHTTIQHFTLQVAAVDRAIAETIDGDDDLRGKRDLLLSIDGVGETLAAVILAEMPGPDVVQTAAQVVAYAGLNPRQFQSGSSINQPTRISRIGNARLRTALFMPAMRKLLMICFGVLKSGRPFDPAIAMPPG